MSTEEENPADIEKLRAIIGGGDRSVAARRTHEARIMDRADRRRMHGGRRTEQTNVKLTVAGKKRLLAICQRETELRGLPNNRTFTLTEFIEESMDMWETRR